MLFTRDNGFGPRERRISSPAVSELEAMIRACEQIDLPMNEIALDVEEWGLVSEWSYCNHGPTLVELLKSITNYARTSTQELRIGDDDEMDFETSPHETEAVLLRFVSEHRRVLEALVAHHAPLATTGDFYRSISMSLRAQRVALENFRAALETKYPLVRLSSRRRFDEMASNLAVATSMFVVSEL